MADQLKGEFLVLRDGTILPDTRDHATLCEAHFEANKGGSYNGWTSLDNNEVEFLACYWELAPGKVKTCVTDRDFNNVEVCDVSIERLVHLLKLVKEGSRTMAPREYPDPAQRYEDLHREERDEAHDADMRERFLEQLEADYDEDDLAYLDDMEDDE